MTRRYLILMPCKQPAAGFRFGLAVGCLGFLSSAKEGRNFAQHHVEARAFVWRQACKSRHLAIVMHGEHSALTANSVSTLLPALPLLWFQQASAGHTAIEPLLTLCHDTNLMSANLLHAIQAAESPGAISCSPG